MRNYLFLLLLFCNVAWSQEVGDSSSLHDELPADSSIFYRKHNFNLDGFGWYSTMANQAWDGVGYKDGELTYKRDNMVYGARFAYTYQKNARFGIGAEYAYESCKIHPDYGGLLYFENDSLLIKVARTYEDFSLNTNMLNLFFRFENGTERDKVSYSNQIGLGAVLSNIRQKDYHYKEKVTYYSSNSAHYPNPYYTFGGAVLDETEQMDKGIDNRPLLEKNNFFGVNLYYAFTVHFRIAERLKLNVGVRGGWCYYFSELKAPGVAQSDYQYGKASLASSVLITRHFGQTSLNMGLTYSIGDLIEDKQDD